MAINKLNQSAEKRVVSQQKVTPFSAAVQRGAEAAAKRTTAILNLRKQAVTDEYLKRILRDEYAMQIRIGSFVSPAYAVCEPFAEVISSAISAYKTADEYVLPNIKQYIQNDPLFEAAKAYKEAQDKR